MMPLLAAELPDLPVPDADPGDVRDAAREILARPEFLPRPRPLMERVLGWIGDVIEEIIAAAAGGGSASVIAIVVLTAAAAVGAWAVVRLVRSIAWRPDGATTVAAADDVGRSAREWLAEAEEHEAAGRWREGVRCRYRALVADLTRRGLVDEIPGRTSGEYRRLVALSLPSAGPPFAAASDTFDRVWYGGRLAGPDEAAAVRAAAAAVVRAAA